MAAAAATTTAGRDLREWGPCAAALSLLPGGGAALAAVDACDEFLALASDAGVVFWYDRGEHSLQRLRCSSAGARLTCVRVASTVDFMVAAGGEAGRVDAFQIPKRVPDGLPAEHLGPNVAERRERQQVERYAIGADLHEGPVACLEWSKNGTKLFSADRRGKVVLTEIDFYMHICKSSVIVDETYEVVQLSYHREALLVSSVSRAIVCRKRSGKWAVEQVGKKDRKSLCKLGGTFLFSYDKPNDVNVYSARPGLRIWSSDDQGNVLKTLLFKEATANPSTEVELLNPRLKKPSVSIKDLNFGPMYVFQNKYLVSHNEDVLYVLDPEKLISIATIDKFNGILSVSVTKDEIFVLEKNRELVRLAYKPDLCMERNSEKMMSRSLFNPIEKAFRTIKNFTKDDTLKLLPDFSEPRNYLKNILNEPTISALPDELDISNAEECIELPPVRRLSDDIDEINLQKSIPFIEIQSDVTFSQNQNLARDEEIESRSNILHSTKRYKKENIVNIDEPNTDNVEKDPKKTKKIIRHESPRRIKPDIMNVSYCGPPSFVLDDSSPESIDKKIRDMEEKLVKALDLEMITLKKAEPIETPIQKPEKPQIVTDSHKQPPKRQPVSNPVKTPAKKSPESNKNLPNSSTVQKPTMPPRELTPQCVSIPGKWNLKEITIKSDLATQDAPKTSAKPKGELKHVSSRVFDSDWELV